MNDKRGKGRLGEGEGEGEDQHQGRRDKDITTKQESKEERQTQPRVLQRRKTMRKEMCLINEVTKCGIELEGRGKRGIMHRGGDEEAWQRRRGGREREGGRGKLE